MKSPILKALFLTVFATQVSAQQTVGITDHSGLPQTFNFNQVPSVSGGKALSYAEIEGNPYLNKLYENVKVDGFNEVLSARYNQYSDEVEFKQGEKVLSFPRTKEYSNIQFVGSKQSLIWLDGAAEYSGYFFVLSNGKNKLLRKNKVRFIDAKPAVSSYAQPTPAKFSNMPSTYFILTENNEMVPLKNSKEIANYFPAEKEKINTFIKSNNIKTDREADLIKLVTFINEN